MSHRHIPLVDVDGYFEYEFRSGHLSPSQEYRAHPAPERTGDLIQNTRNEVKFATDVHKATVVDINSALDKVEAERKQEREKHASEKSTLERRVAELEEGLRTAQRLFPYDSGLKLIVNGLGVSA